jgi:hypothetical protein
MVVITMNESNGNRGDLYRTQNWNVAQENVKSDMAFGGGGGE